MVRIVDMNNVDINKIQFDYDLVFAIVFINAHDHVYSRYGNRTPWNAESRFSLDGLKYTMRQVIKNHDKTRRPPNVQAERFLARDLFSSKRSCIHCHQVWEGLRGKARKEKSFDPRSLFVYPRPENIGLQLHVDFGNKVLDTKPNSPCAKAGVKPGDLINNIDGHAIFSQADVTWALHNGPETGEITVEFSRDRKPKRVKIHLKPGWKETKLSWRASMRNEPAPKDRGQ